MIGYSNQDWGMGGWYAREDTQQRREDEECRLVRMRLAECRKIAESIAYEFRFADGNTTDADFLATIDNECWHDWLLCEAAEQGKREYGDNDLYAAMLLICQQEIEDFTDYAWVLTQVKKLAHHENDNAIGDKTMGLYAPDFFAGTTKYIVAIILIIFLIGFGLGWMVFG